jgi:hypothetical protein
MISWYFKSKPQMLQIEGHELVPLKAPESVEENDPGNENSGSA